VYCNFICFPPCETWINPLTLNKVV